MQWRGSSAQLSMGTLSNESCSTGPWHHTNQRSLLVVRVRSSSSNLPLFWARCSPGWSLSLETEHSFGSASDRDDQFTPCYASPLDSLLGSSGAVLWIHVHDAVDYVIGSTRVVANPRGYPEETGRESGPFRWDLIVELPA
jgi:hypothetical protein